ncbi:preprotein translocase subunit SecE [Lentibacillus persicus]|uniref:Protein translocase subunit SecE n=1 Tax=Lentibacillus persicus TaxID=640948 RepID=A0A1I2AGH5_9BACI|nr:preprotein translocase subunit SecE [Lentibacillus persicus]
MIGILRQESGGTDVKIGKFFKDVAREMKKVSWPKGRELTSYTITVLSTVAFVAVFFAVIDLGISQFLNMFF